MKDKFRKKIISLLVSLILLLILVAFQNILVKPDELELPQLGTAQVIKIIDGDTINISIDGKIESVRLIGIDTPEVKGPYTKEECFGPESSIKLNELLSSQEIQIQTDSLSTNRDKYQRLLRYVYLDGVNINAQMVKEGYARMFPAFAFDMYQDFLGLEKLAKENNRGLWQDCK